MSLIYNQSGGTTTCGQVITCGPTLDAGAFDRRAHPNPGGSNNVLSLFPTFRVSKVFIMWELEIPAGVTWSAGTWRIEIEVATGGSINAKIDNAFACRVNSSCVFQSSIGNMTISPPSITGDQNGVHSLTFSGSSQTPSAGDKVYCTVRATATSQGLFFLKFKSNQTITCPFTFPAPRVSLGTGIRAEHKRIIASNG